MIPKTIAPTVKDTNSLTVPNTEIDYPPFTSWKLIVIRTMQVPSLNKDYPSIKERNFFGAPASFRRAKTATVSVQESTDPNIKASDQL